MLTKRAAVLKIVVANVDDRRIPACETKQFELYASPHRNAGRFSAKTECNCVRQSRKWILNASSKRELERIE